MSKNQGIVNYLGVIVPCMDGVREHRATARNAIQTAKQARIIAKTITAMENDSAWNLSFEDQSKLEAARAIFHNIACMRNE